VQLRRPDPRVQSNRAGRSRAPAAALLLALLAASPTQADVVFDSFLPGDDFQTEGFLSVANDPILLFGFVVGNDADWARAFVVPDQDYELDAIEVPLLLLSEVADCTGTGCVNDVEIILHEDDPSVSSGRPGNELERIPLDGVLSEGGVSTGRGSVVTALSSLHPVLQAGQRYWVEVSAGIEGSPARSLVLWHMGAEGDVLTQADQMDEGTWLNRSAGSAAMRVYGMPPGAAVDTDHDGLLDTEEADLGTDPQNPDTDGDGLSDGDEVALGTDPRVADTDHDGLLDGQEAVMGTNPLDPDSDHDGVLDGAEVAAGMDPMSPDSDGDGIDDAHDPDRIGELVAGLPAAVFPDESNTRGHRKAFLARLQGVEQAMASGDSARAWTLLHNLRQRVDGCDSLGTEADADDWIVECESQVEVRDVIDEMMGDLGRVAHKGGGR
jgi:hypothetical protein